MLLALRHRAFALVALLFLLSASAVDLCRHGLGGAPAEAGVPPTASAFACGDCGDCCESGAGGEADHCHACLCACHSVGVLAAAGGLASNLSAAPIAATPAPQRAAGFHAALERPPLAS
ncbi:hypothetical protein FJ251_06105 [bacterium]|nr:hypothetical protein [bacterium]